MPSETLVKTGMTSSTDRPSFAATMGAITDVTTGKATPTIVDPSVARRAAHLPSFLNNDMLFLHKKARKSAGGWTVKDCLKVAIRVLEQSA
jgi:hypothetical protein